MHTGYLHDYLMRDLELIKTDYTSNELSALDSSYQYSGYGRDALTSPHLNKIQVGNKYRLSKNEATRRRKSASAGERTCAGRARHHYGSNWKAKRRKRRGARVGKVVHGDHTLSISCETKASQKKVHRNGLHLSRENRESFIDE